MHRAIVAFVLGLLVVASCKDASKATPAPAASASTAAAPLKRMANGQCPPLGSTCAEGEFEKYVRCVDEKCDDANKACFGADYKTAPGGPCVDQMKCTRACDCNDAACMRKCAPSTECVDCMKKSLFPCMANSGCYLPACADVGGH
jgi:hypothetical protein